MEGGDLRVSTELPFQANSLRLLTPYTPALNSTSMIVL